MKEVKKYYFLVLLSFILAISSVQAYTNVSSCATLSTANEEYRINESFVPNNAVSSSYCILANAENITIDGQSLTMINQTYGGACIYINRNNVTVKNLYCDVSDTSSGAPASGVNIPANTIKDAKILDSTINGSYIGVYLRGINSLVSNVTFRDNYAYGIYGSTMHKENNTIVNNTFIGGTFTTYYALHIENSSNYIVDNNQYYNTSGSSKIVLRAWGNSTNINISNNIFHENNASYTLYALNLYNSSVFNNVITNYDDSGTTLAIHSSENVNTFNNTLNNSISNYYYIDYWYGSRNSKVYNNHVKCNSNADSEHGIIFHIGNNLTAYGNYIEGCSFGFLFHNATTNSTMYDTTLVNNTVNFYLIDEAEDNVAYNFTTLYGREGVHLYRYEDRNTHFSPRNNRFYNFTITNCSQEGISLGNETHNNLFQDGVISNCLTDSVDAYDLSYNNTLLNVTYNISLENAEAGTNFTRKWWYEASATPSSASITVKNVSNIIVANGTGTIAKTALTDYFNNGGTRVYSTPHTRTATASGYDTGTLTINLTALGNYFDSIVLTQTVVESSSGSSSGSLPSYSISDSDLASGKSILIGKNWNAKFKINNAPHALEITDLTADKIKIKLHSEVTEFYLLIGEEKKIDLNSDGIYDLRINLNTIKKYLGAFKAEISIKKIYEEAPSKNSEEVNGVQIPEESNKSNKSNLYIYLILGVIIFGIIILVLNKDKTPNYKNIKNKFH